MEEKLSPTVGKIHMWYTGKSKQDRGGGLKMCISQYSVVLCVNAALSKLVFWAIYTSIWGMHCMVLCLEGRTCARQKLVCNRKCLSSLGFFYNQAILAFLAVHSVLERKFKKMWKRRKYVVVK